MEGPMLNRMGPSYKLMPNLMKGQKRGYKRSNKRSNILKSLNKRVAHIEMSTQPKHHDTELIGVTSAYDNVYFLTLNDPIQGDEDTSRIGDRIICKKLEVNQLCLQGGSSATAVRILIIHDFNNTITTAAQVFAGYSGDFATVYQPITWDSKSNFKILHDAFIPIRSWDESGVGRVSIAAVSRFTLKFNIQTRFDSTSTTINAGSIKLVFASNAPNTGTKPSLNAYYRLVFVDS